MANERFDDHLNDTENESWLDKLEREEQEELAEAKKKEKAKKKKRFNIFDTQREGKGVKKDEKKYPPNLMGFWQSYRRNVGRLIMVNLAFVFGNFPIFFIIAGLTDFTKVEYLQPVSIMNQVLASLSMAEDVTSPATLAMLGADGLLQIGYMPTTLTYILFGIGLLVFFTFGLTNVAATYIIRNLITGQPVFMLSDFFYAIRRNFKQGFFFGILDLLLLIVIPFDVIFLLQSSTGFFSGVLLWLNLAFGLIYIFMRYYIYIQMVTFDLSILKILKNSLIFAFVGLKRNFAAFVGILLSVLINVSLLMTVPTMAIGLVLPFLFLFAHCTYMSAYAAYFKIKELMIDPYIKNDDEIHEDPILLDRG